MKLLITCVFAFYSLFSDHDVQVASFTIYDKFDKVYFELVFEKDDFDFLLIENRQSGNEQLLTQYLNEHFKINLNKKPSLISYDKIKFDTHHIKITGEISKPKKKIKSIKINNTCLLNIEEHSNVIQLRMNNQERDFLMNKSRQEIFLKF